MSTCQRIFTMPNDEQWTCEAPAKWLAWGDTRFCDDCLHAVFEDEPVECFNANVVALEAPKPQGKQGESQ